MHRMPRFLAVLSMIVISLFQAGCWSSIEINERAIVTLAAFDKAETPDKVAITLQIANPSRVRQGGKDAVLIFSTTANTIFEASRILRNTVPRKPFWGQTQVIIISEALAKEGITEWLDFMDRDFEPNRRVWLLIARGALARDLLQAGFGFNPISATTLVRLIESAKVSGNAVVANLNEIIMGLEAEGRNTATGFIELAQEKASPPGQVDLEQRVVLKGTALFKKDKLVGYLDAKESRGVNWILGNIGNTLMVVPGDIAPIALEVVEAKSNVKPEIKNGNPSVTVQVSAVAHVADVRTRSLDLTNPDVVDSLNRKLATSIKAEMEKAVKKAQALHSDIFDFGKAFCCAYVKEWKKAQEEWSDQVFPYLDVRFDVRAEVTHSGFLLKPVRAK